MMGFEIYTPDFSNRYEISHAISVRTSVFYNGIGKISIILPADDFNIQAVQLGGLVLDKKHFDTFFIRNVEIDTERNQIRANGYTANEKLNQRAVLAETPIENIESGIYSLIASNLRGLPNVETATVKGLTAKSSVPAAPGQLLDQIISILSGAEYGHRTIWDYRRKKHIFEIYQGVDRSSGIHAAIFSPERGTAENLIITDDDTTLKNCFYISGKTTGDKVIIENIGADIPAAERREKWISEQLTQNSEQTESQFRESMKAKIREVAEDYIQRQNFSIDISPDDYGNMYNLGDIITCFSARFGVKFNKRVNCIKYELDTRGEKTSLILGEKKLNVLEVERLNGKH